MALAFYDYIKWSGDIGVLAYRHPKNNIKKNSKLQVTEAQEAVIVVNGQKSQKFSAGTYELNSPNVPILSAFYGIPYGGDNPWVVQTWFINKLTPMDIKWSTDSFNIYDETFGAAIPIAASGQYGITVVDAEKFILKLALGFPYDKKEGVVVTASDFTKQLYGELIIHTKSIITKVMAANKIGITAVSAHLVDLSKHIENQINLFFEEFGCKILKLFVTNIEVDKSTESGRKIAESIDQQTVQKISGHTWQQGKMFETVGSAFDSMSSGGGGILGAVMAVNMMGGGNGSAMGGSLMTPTYGQPTCAPVTENPTQGVAELQQTKVPKEIYCTNCSKKFSSQMQFCPHCGDRYNPCPNCGSDNDESAKRCVSCGVVLNTGQVVSCGGCGKFISSSLSFCPNCGRPQGSGEAKCPRCSAAVGTSKFCPQCGFQV